ncbi:MAG TPA: glycosyltransferase [Blastocatellia bacterium]|nr:glycosyltransferase [Blastocatellia bacterium]
MKLVCFCPTRNRRRWLPGAIACLQAQTVTDWHMLIVADGEPVHDLMPNDPRVRLLTIVDNRNWPTLGQKFNFCCENASMNGRADILCKWDDDDYSAPGRLADQLSRLETSGKAVTGYHSMLFTDGEKWHRYRGTPDFALGTSLMFRRDWWERHRFESLPVGSDIQFARMAAAAGQLAAVDAGQLMVASSHAGNSSPRKMTGASWEPLPNFSGVSGYEWPIAA